MKKYLFLGLCSFFLFSSSLLPAQSPYAQSGIGLGIIVQDLPASIQFYQDILGLSHSRDFQVVADIAKRTGLSNGVAFEVHAFKLQDDPDAPELKLMTFPNSPKRTISKHIQDDTGVQYLTLMVKSLKPILERLEAHDIPLLGETPLKMGENRYFVLVQDPDGTFIELIGPKE